MNRWAGLTEEILADLSPLQREFIQWALSSRARAIAQASALKVEVDRLNFKLQERDETLDELFGSVSRENELREVLEFGRTFVAAAFVPGEHTAVSADWVSEFLSRADKALGREEASEDER